jgi:hypothetical protein
LCYIQSLGVEFSLQSHRCDKRIKGEKVSETCHICILELCASQLEAGWFVTQVVTSCNSTKDELVAEVNAVSQPLKVDQHGTKDDKDITGLSSLSTRLTFKYIDHIRTYPTFRFGGVEGSQVSTVAFALKA